MLQHETPIVAVPGTPETDLKMVQKSAWSQDASQTYFFEEKRIAGAPLVEKCQKWFQKGWVLRPSFR